MNAEFIALLKSLFIPIWGLFCVAVVWIIRTRPANRSADNEARRIENEAAASAEAITNAQFERFNREIERLEADRDDCRAEAEQYRRERDEARRERDEERAVRLTWEAVAEGVGRNRQEEAIVSSAERLIEDKRGEEGDELA